LTKNQWGGKKSRVPRAGPFELGERPKSRAGVVFGGPGWGKELLLRNRERGRKKTAKEKKKKLRGGKLFFQSVRFMKTAGRKRKKRDLRWGEKKKGGQRTKKHSVPKKKDDQEATEGTYVEIWGGGGQ